MSSLLIFPKQNFMTIFHNENFVSICDLFPVVEVTRHSSLHLPRQRSQLPQLFISQRFSWLVPDFNSLSVDSNMSIVLQLIIYKLVLLSFFIQFKRIKTTCHDLVLERFVQIACHNDLSHHVLPIRVTILPTFEQMLQPRQADPLVPGCCELKLIESNQKHLVLSKRFPQNVASD